MRWFSTPRIALWRGALGGLGSQIHLLMEMLVAAVATHRSPQTSGRHCMLALARQHSSTAAGWSRSPPPLTPSIIIHCCCHV